MIGRERWLYAAVAALALLASANSLANGFVYDDVALIVRSSRVHSWDAWWTEFARTYWPEGDGYRPFTMLAWRAQWALGGGSPIAFHAMNVVLHVATSVAVLRLALLIMPAAAAGVAAALFAVHPVHVEAIASIVGQSELFVALALVIAVDVYVRARNQGVVSARAWTVIALLYAAACLFKEHAIVLPALLLAAEVTVVTDAGAMRQRFAQMRLPLLSLGVVAFAYLWARSAVMVDGIAGFRPFVVFQVLQLSAFDRVLTMIGAATEWFRLLLWPARLATQYSPPAIHIANGVSVELLPGVLLLFATLGLMAAAWKRKPVVAFGLAWTIIALLPASNFLVPAGFLIAERTLLLPSVGAMIALASALAFLQDIVVARRLPAASVAAVVAMLLALGLARSVTRNRVWESDDRLWRQGVADAPDSYLAHFRLGLHLFATQRPAEGERHYRRSIELFPYDPLVVYSFAEQLRVAGRCDAALPLYGWLFKTQPESRRGHLGRASCYLGARKYDDAQQDAIEWLKRGGRVTSAREILLAARAGKDSLRTRLR
jgi:tetratricopeptide (TPR) repeat protein